jgi:mono/diheme cytochrome c family protein
MNPRANKLLLLVASTLTAVLLLTAAYQENVLQEWRRLQRDYKRRLPPAAAAEFNIQLRQVVVPAQHVADRCVSCHVGMAAGEPGIDGDRVFGRHPKVAHDPAEFGCTTCHGGQGRATERDAAHGDVRHWPEPMLPRRHVYAGCGTCHTHIAVPSVAALDRGRNLIERNDCLACHKLDGRGGTARTLGAGGMEGPDLSRAGGDGFDRDWHAKHVARRDTTWTAAWRTSFAPLLPGDQAAIEVALASRVGAPGLVEAKALFHTLGCRGCHKVNGVGGDDGPDLSRIGSMDPGQRDFTNVPGPRTVDGWLAQHFRAPARVVPGSAMPELGLDEDQIESLTRYLLSLRQSAKPEAFWPKDRIRALRFGAREFAPDGATLYGAFCAACHGGRGEGMRYPGTSPFPAIANPDFLALASDPFIRATIERGRRGRRMPAWGASEGGLRPSEIDSVVAHVRRLGGVAAEGDARPARWVVGDAAAGARAYAANCASCHGAAGAGGEGPALAEPTFLAHATDTYLVETTRRGRRGTSMQGFGTGSVTRRTLSPDEIEAIVAFMRTWEAEP